MEIWLDSADINTIKKASQLGILTGVTTNPSIIAQSGKSLENALKEILKTQKGPVAAQVLAARAQDIVEQAEILRDFSERIIVKIPVTQEGLKAINSLAHLELPIMATAIITPFQALLACHAGATYLAPYYSHIEKQHNFHDEVLETMVHFIETYHFDAKIIVASIRNLDHMMTCLGSKVHGVTIKPDLFEKLIEDHTTTLTHIEKFKKDASEGKSSKLYQ